MGRHAVHDVHPNSRLSLAGMGMAERKALVLSAYLLAGVPLTDRQANERLGFDDLNMTRPAVSRLVDDGQLWECGAVKCPESGRRVRLCEPTSLARKGGG